MEEPQQPRIKVDFGVSTASGEPLDWIHHAEHFLDAVQPLWNSSRHLVPSMVLLGYAVELALKAFLLEKRAATLQEVKDHSHDLSKLLQRAKGAGLPEGILDPRDVEQLDALFDATPGTQRWAPPHTRTPIPRGSLAIGLPTGPIQLEPRRACLSPHTNRFHFARREPACDTSAMPRTAKQRGRQPDASSKSGQIRELLKTGMAPMDIAKKVGCTPALVYNVKARLAGDPKKRGPGRPPKAKSGGATRVDGLDGLLAAVRSVERERNEMRAVLENVRAVLWAALGG